MNTDDGKKLRDDDCKVIRVPDDNGTIKVGLNDCIYLKFTRAGNFTCSDKDSFNPPLPDGQHVKAGKWGPATPNADYDGANIIYNLGGDQNKTVEAKVVGKTTGPILGDAGGHVIHIGSNTLNLLFVLARNPQFRDTLFRYWPDTRIFLSALVKLEDDTMHADHRRFLETLIKAGDNAYARKPSSEEGIST